jgi:hypothetical protein
MKPKSTDLGARSPFTSSKVISPKTRLTDQKYLAPKALRSAMADVEASGPRTAMKTVRFALTYRDLNEEILSAEFPNGMTPTAFSNPLFDPSVQNLPPVPDAAPRPDFKKSVQRSASLAHREGLKYSVDSKETHSRHSLPTRLKARETMAAVDDKADFVKHVSSRMSTHSLGRSSLSRIMRGPMFARRDNKNATISLGAQSRLDENLLRRESRIPSSVEKKSRMPVPLRNIFTRFR